MSSFLYKMISVVACEEDYLAEASVHLNGVMQELRETLPRISACFGVFRVGRHTGSLGLIHLYRELNDVDPAFGVYGNSAGFAKMASSGKIALRQRNLYRLREGSWADAEPAPGYLVYDHFAPPGLSDTHLSQLKEQSGSAGMRFIWPGMQWTGNEAGRFLLATGSSQTTLQAAQQTVDDLLATQAAGDTVQHAERDVLETHV